MKHFFLALILTCQIFTPDYSQAQEKPAAVPVDGDIQWVFDLAEGQRIAKESKKPLFLVFRCER